MRPLAFINGVILGSAGSLASVLGVILFFRWVMAQDPSLDQSVVQSQLPLGQLLRDMGVFALLTAAAVAGFWGELRQRAWRGAADFVLAVTVSAVFVYFFAAPAARVADFAFLVLLAAVIALLYKLARWAGLFARLERWLGE
jgi:hypothetical protein